MAMVAMGTRGRHDASPSRTPLAVLSSVQFENTQIG
eukprot:CAMPEP_0183548388 /NCGR_PEP_ID=MMETSP0371-20130417/59364_1 /TAXON_ID=268820 /ORGANISM="Peridinium aciculiferum, Strain PAER-2" /LENGTH=35 /DNA_ID= /DNA_START= /DNA_END= /DNA_ORIENTATION=